MNNLLYFPGSRESANLAKKLQDATHSKVQNHGKALLDDALNGSPHGRTLIAQNKNDFKDP